MPRKSKSKVVSGIDLVQLQILPLMKAAGFAKRGRSFNRPAEDGIIHVLNFQSGQYPLGKNYVVPGLRESLYGDFTINLGVHLPQVFELETPDVPPVFLQEYDCQIRIRLGQLLTDGVDVWWSATDSVEETAARFPGLVEKFALPFLERFRTQEDVINEWRNAGELPFCNPGRSSLIAAVLLHADGDLAEATMALQNAIALNQNPGFHDYVRTIAKKLTLAI